MEIKRLLNPVILIIVTVVFFYKSFFFLQVPFPGDLLISEYAPWKYESYIGYNPGSYPSKFQYFDVIRQLFPWKMLVIEELKEGRIPLWNPYNFSGTPLLANHQSAVFNPFNILFFAFQPAVAWSIFIIIQPLLASFFTYLYLRQIKLSSISSLFGGVSFGFSLFMATFLEYGNFGHTIMWMPLALFIGEKISKKEGYHVLFPFSIACIIFSGHLQLAFGALAFILLYILFVLQRKKILLFLYFLGIAIASIQLLPTLELISLSARISHDIDVLSQNFLLQFHQLVLFISPDAYGNPATRNYLLTDSYPGNAAYVGVGILLFAAYSIKYFKKNFYIKYFLLTSAILLILLTNNFVSVAFYLLKLPFLSSSSPANFLFLLSFALSVLGAIGMEYWQKKKDAFIFIILGMLLLFFAMLVGLHQILQIEFLPKQTAIGFGLLAIMGVILFFVSKIGKGILFYSFLIISCVELFYYFHKFNPFVPSELVYPATEISSSLQKTLSYDRFIGYKAANIESNFSTLYKLYSPDGYDPLYPATYNKYTSSSSRSDVFISIENEKIINELGVKYILDRRENGADEKVFPPERLEKIDEINNWIIYENKNVFPRAYIIADEGIVPAEIITYLPNKVEIKNPIQNGMLVLTDNYYPGWKASIEGKEREIMRINSVFRGVKVTKSDTSIIFEYQPKSFYIGMILTIIGMGILTVYLVFKKTWKK